MESPQAQTHIENLYQLGCGFADEVAKSIVESEDIGAFLALIKNLPGNPVFVDAFMGRIADLVAKGYEAEYGPVAEQV